VLSSRGVSLRVPGLARPFAGVYHAGMFGFVVTPCARCTRDSYPAWRGAFCGLARCLAREFGYPARLLVNRDAAFVGLLGLSLDPEIPSWKQATCCNPLARPFPVADDHPAILHAAAVSVCGLAAKLSDDARDEGFIRRTAARLGRLLVSPATNRAVAMLNSTSFPTGQVLAALGSQEAIESADPLRADEPTAAAYGAITSHLVELLDRPAQREALHRTGAALGSLVYWRDAWQDRREDARRGRFNPFATSDPEAIRERIASSWNAFCSALGGLPFVRHADLISNMQTTTARQRRRFLGLEADEPSGKSGERARRREERRIRKADRDRSDCCHNRDCADGCCCLGVACDAGPCDAGCCDTGCCDCSP